MSLLNLLRGFFQFQESSHAKPHFSWVWNASYTKPNDWESQKFDPNTEHHGGGGEHGDGEGNEGGGELGSGGDHDSAPVSAHEAPTSGHGAPGSGHGEPVSGGHHASVTVTGHGPTAPNGQNGHVGGDKPSPSHFSGREASSDAGLMDHPEAPGLEHGLPTTDGSPGTHKGHAVAPSPPKPDFSLGIDDSAFPMHGGHREAPEVADVTHGEPGHDTGHGNGISGTHEAVNGSHHENSHSDVHETIHGSSGGDHDAVDGRDHSGVTSNAEEPSEGVTILLNAAVLSGSPPVPNWPPSGLGHFPGGNFSPPASFITVQVTVDWNASTEPSTTVYVDTWPTRKVRTRPPTTPAPPATTTELVFTVQALKNLCWENKVAFEGLENLVTESITNVLEVLIVELFRDVFVRFMAKCWFWDLETVPGYAHFRISENVLGLIVGQQMTWWVYN